MCLSKCVFQIQEFQKYLSYEAVFLFEKCSKFNVDSKKAIKILQKVFGFLNDCIWSGSCKFSLLWRVYSSPVVNVLINGLLLASLASFLLFFRNSGKWYE